METPPTFSGSVYFDAPAGDRASISGNTGLDFRFSFTLQLKIKVADTGIDPHFGPIFSYDHPWTMPIYLVSIIWDSGMMGWGIGMAG